MNHDQATLIGSTGGTSAADLPPTAISTEDLTLHIDMYGKVREPETRHYFKMEGTKVIKIDAMQQRNALQARVNKDVMSQVVKIPRVKKERDWTDFRNLVFEKIEKNKLKFSLTCVLVVVLTVVLVNIYGLFDDYVNVGPLSQGQWLAAFNGTSLEQLSPVPSRGMVQSSRRRLQSSHQNTRLRLQSAASFSAISDYHLRLDPNYVVLDEGYSSISESVYFANRMSCYMDQVRVAEVGVGPRLNPLRKPYIALVDPSLCDSSSSSDMMTWTIEALAPSAALGDGVYMTNFLFNENSYSYKAVLRNTVVTGDVIMSELYWEGYTSTTMSGSAQIKGAVSINYADLPQVDVQFIQDTWNSGTNVYDTVHMHSEYNHATQTGYSVSTDADYYYEFGFDSSKLLKNVGGTQGVGFIQADCYNFSIDSRLLIHDDYNLYSATDGSLIGIEEGLVIERSNFPGTRAFITNKDAYPLPTQSSSSWVFDRSWLYNGVDVHTVASDGSVDTSVDYDLGIVNGRLLKMTNHHISLGSMVNRPMKITSQFNDVSYIQWDGTKLVTLATTSNRCVYINSDGKGNEIQLSGGFFVEEYIDCYCLSQVGNTNEWSKRTSGSYDRRYNSTTQDIMMETISQDVAGTPSEFVPTITDFPRGIPVSFDGIDGLIELDYNASQSLVGLKHMDYRVGDILTQSSTGARGVVSVDTPYNLHGFVCSNCISVTSTKKSAGSCGSTTSSWTTSTLQPGLYLSQSSSGAAGYVADISDVVGGISVTIDGSINFDLTGNIVVSMPSSISKGSILEQYDMSGTITAPTTATLDIHALTVTKNAVCLTDYAEFSASVTGASSATVQVFYYLGVTHAYIDNIGNSCNNPNVTVSASHFDCFNGLPEISIKCTTRISKMSSTATVDLSNDVPFNASSEVLLTTYDYGDVHSASSPVTVYNKISAINSITKDTVLTYGTEEIVSPTTSNTDVSLALRCYEDCPNDNVIETCEGNDSSCYHDDHASHLSKEVTVIKAGSCTTAMSSDLPTLNFTHIGGSPSIEVTWNSVLTNHTTGVNTSSVRAMVVADPGKDCNDHDLRPTVTFVDSKNVCGSDLPTAHITCLTNANDLSDDFRSVHGYDYNKNTGSFIEISSVVMTNNANVTSGSVKFGPFYATNDLNRANLHCPYSDDEVCTYRAWSQLDSMYFYETGPDAKRVVPQNGDNHIQYGSPLYLTYVHTGEKSNSGKNYSGATFVLKYSGPGQLSGLPQFCFDPSTGQATTTCVPQDSDGGTVQKDDISIPSDAILYSNGVGYLAAAATVYEVYPKDTSAGACSFNMNNLPTTPSLDSLTLLMNHTYNTFPSDAMLESSFLNKGVPSVVRGQTLEELGLTTT